MIRSRGKISSLLLNLALLAFLVRSLVPVGFMPAQNAHATYPLVICSGYGPVTIHVTTDKFPSAPAQPARGHDNMPCSYAQAFAQGIAVDIAALPFFQFVTEQSESWNDTFVAHFTFKSYLSQGPPFFPA